MPRLYFSEIPYIFRSFAYYLFHYREYQMKNVGIFDKSMKTLFCSIKLNALKNEPYLHNKIQCYCHCAYQVKVNGFEHSWKKCPFFEIHLPREKCLIVYSASKENANTDREVSHNWVLQLLPEGILQAMQQLQGLTMEILIKLDSQIVKHIPGRQKTGRSYTLHVSVEERNKDQIFE